VRRPIALLVLATFLPACGGGPRIQSSIRGEPQYQVENWVPIPGTDDVGKNKGLITLGDARIRFESSEAQPVDFAYEEVTYASHALSKKPSWGLGIGLALICLPCLAFAFIKRKQHWISIQTTDKQLLLKAKKNSYAQLISALEGKGVDVERLAGE